MIIVYLRFIFKNLVMRINDKIVLTDEEIGDDHISTSDFTPIRDDAFDKSDEEKISIIQEHVKEIMLL